MKHAIPLAVSTLLFLLMGCDKNIKEKAKNNLPWYSTVTTEGYNHFFGKPDEKVKVTETAEYWFYPSLPKKVVLIIR